MAFFGGILGILALIGAVFSSSDNSTDTTSQGTIANTTSYTLPTVAQTEPTSTTSPPTTIAEVTVPKLVGMRAGTARSNLAGHRLHSRITYKTTSRYPSGTVISQSRQGGTDVRPGSTITLTIAKAPPVTTPPTTEPAPPPKSNCDPAYPNDCIPPPPPDLDCADIGHRVEVDHRYGDPHRLDADGDGIGCDSWGHPTSRLRGRRPGEEWFYLRDAGPSRWVKVVVAYEGTRGEIRTAFARRTYP